jgi:hypothetical protein
MKAMIKDAIFYKFIILKSDGYLYHADTSSLLGKNIADVAEYLSNPLNEDILTKLLSSVDEQWNK